MWEAVVLRGRVLIMNGSLGDERLEPVIKIRLMRVYGSGLIIAVIRHRVILNRI